MHAKNASIEHRRLSLQFMMTESASRTGATQMVSSKKNPWRPCGTSRTVVLFIPAGFFPASLSQNNSLFFHVWLGKELLAVAWVARVLHGLLWWRRGRQWLRKLVDWCAKPEAGQMEILQTIMLSRKFILTSILRQCGLSWELIFRLLRLCTSDTKN